MKKLIRKWILKLKRRRYHKALRADGNYKALENRVRDTGSLCSNCNAPLTGPFCHICGQKDDDLKRPIWTLLREILDDVFSTDSRLIKTLFLLVLVPGGVTRAFREGRRARFVPPLRLYFIVSILFFLIISVADILILDINVTPIDTKPPTEAEEPLAPQPVASAPVTGAPVTENAIQDTRPEETKMGLEGAATQEAAPLAEQPGGPLADPEGSKAQEDTSDTQLLPDPEVEARRAVAEAKLVDASKRLKDLLGEDFEALPPEAQKAILDAQDGKGISKEELKKAVDDAEKIRDNVKVDLGFPYDIKVDMFVANTGEEREGLKQEDIDKVLNDPDTPMAVKKAVRGFAEALKNPVAFNDLFNDWLPRALFVLMPIFALILRFFHWGKDRVYLQQIVFSLHFHTFLFMLMTALMVIVPEYGGQLGVGIFWWGTSLYLIIALKVGQNQGWIRAFLKAGFIWVSYFVVMMIVMFSVVFVGLSDIKLWDLMTGHTEDFEVSGDMAPTVSDQLVPEGG